MSKETSSINRAEGAVRRTGSDQCASHACPGHGASWTSLDMPYSRHEVYNFGLRLEYKKPPAVPYQEENEKPCPPTPHKLNTPAPNTTTHPLRCPVPQVLTTSLCQSRLQRMVRRCVVITPALTLPRHRFRKYTPNIPLESWMSCK